MICHDCEREFPHLGEACRCCGYPMPAGMTGVDGCGQCVGQPNHIQRLYAWCVYQSPIDVLVQKVKFKKQLGLARELGRRLGEWLSQQIEHKPDAVVPVPLSGKRFVDRGFNQALEMARGVAAALDRPLLTNWVKRTRHTQPQSKLTAHQRQNNLRGAFKLSQIRQDIKRVLLVDDVMSTGATLQALAAVLRRAHVVPDAVVLARAI